MPIWTLRPIEYNQEIWTAYLPFQRIVVRARSEDEARALASMAAFSSGTVGAGLPRGPDNDLLPNPWNYSAETSCMAMLEPEKLFGAEVDPDGASRVLEIWESAFVGRDERQASSVVTRQGRLDPEQANA